MTPINPQEYNAGYEVGYAIGYEQGKRSVSEDQSLRSKLRTCQVERLKLKSELQEARQQIQDLLRLDDETS